MIERDQTRLFLDNSYSKSKWGEAPGNGRWLNPIGLDPKSVPGTFALCEVYGFHFQSQKHDQMGYYIVFS